MSHPSDDLSEARLGPRGLVRRLFRLADGTFAPKGQGRVLRPGETVRIAGIRSDRDYKGIVSRDGKTVKLTDGPQAGERIAVAKAAPASPGFQQAKYANQNRPKMPVEQLFVGQKVGIAPTFTYETYSEGKVIGIEAADGKPTTYVIDVGLDEPVRTNSRFLKLHPDSLPADQAPGDPMLNNYRGYLTRLAEHDWYFQMADDHGSWRAGSNEQKRLVDEATGDPIKQKMLADWKNYMFSGPGFDSEKAPRPELDFYELMQAPPEKRRIPEEILRDRIQDEAVNMPPPPMHVGYDEIDWENIADVNDPRLTLPEGIRERDPDTGLPPEGTMRVDRLDRGESFTDGAGNRFTRLGYGPVQGSDVVRDEKSGLQFQLSTDTIVRPDKPSPEMPGYPTWAEMGPLSSLSQAQETKINKVLAQYLKPNLFKPGPPYVNDGNGDATRWFEMTAKLMKAIDPKATFGPTGNDPGPEYYALVDHALHRIAADGIVEPDQLENFLQDIGREDMLPELKKAAPKTAGYDDDEELRRRAAAIALSPEDQAANDAADAADMAAYDEWEAANARGEIIEPEGPPMDPALMDELDGVEPPELEMEDSYAAKNPRTPGYIDEQGYSNYLSELDKMPVGSKVVRGGKEWTKVKLDPAKFSPPFKWKSDDGDLLFGSQLPKEETAPKVEPQAPSYDKTSLYIDLGSLDSEAQNLDAQVGDNKSAQIVSMTEELKGMSDETDYVFSTLEDVALAARDGMQSTDNEDTKAAFREVYDMAYDIRKSMKAAPQTPGYRIGPIRNTDESYVINSPASGPYSVTTPDGKTLGEFTEWDDALAAIEADKEKQQFWPDTFLVNERGDIDRLDSEGNVMPWPTEIENTGEAMNALGSLDMMKDFDKLGWAVQEQAEKLYMDGVDEEELNSNAVQMINDWLAKYDLENPDEIADAIERSKAYSDLGWAIAGQLDDILQGEALEDKNPNALEYIERFLRGQARYGSEDADWDSLAEEVDNYLRLKRIDDKSGPQSPGYKTLKVGDRVVVNDFPGGGVGEVEEVVDQPDGSKAYMVYMDAIGEVHGPFGPDEMAGAQVTPQDALDKLNDALGKTPPQTPGLTDTPGDALTDRQWRIGDVTYEIVGVEMVDGELMYVIHNDKNSEEKLIPVQTMLAEGKAHEPTELELREAVGRNAVKKATTGARGLIRDIMRLDDGTFAPKGMGRVLRPGQEVRVPRTDGKGGFVRGKVDAKGAVDLLDGPDAGTKINLRKPKAAPKTPGMNEPNKDAFLHFAEQAREEMRTSGAYEGGDIGEVWLPGGYSAESWVKAGETTGPPTFQLHKDGKPVGEPGSPDDIAGLYARMREEAGDGEVKKAVERMAADFKDAASSEDSAFEVGPSLSELELNIDEIHGLADADTKKKLDAIRDAAAEIDPDAPDALEQKKALEKQVDALSGGKPAPQTPGPGEMDLESGLKVGLALNDVLNHLDSDINGEKPLSSMQLEDKLAQLDSQGELDFGNLTSGDRLRVAQLAEERGFQDLAARLRKDGPYSQFSLDEMPIGSTVTVGGQEWDKIAPNKWESFDKDIMFSEELARASRPGLPKDAPATPGVPGPGDGFVDNADTPNPISLEDMQPGTLFKLKNGDTYRWHKTTANGGVIGKPVKMADGTTGGKAKFFNGKLAPKQINTEGVGADVPAPAKKAAKSPGGLNLSNLGPKGNPRNVKKMSDSKLKALSQHPDVEPALKERVDKELTNRGLDVPGGGAKSAPPKNAAEMLKGPGATNADLVTDEVPAAELADKLDKAISKKKGAASGGFEMPDSVSREARPAVQEIVDSYLSKDVVYPKSFNKMIEELQDTLLTDESNGEWGDDIPDVLDNALKEVFKKGNWDSAGYDGDKAEFLLDVGMEDPAAWMEQNGVDASSAPNAPSAADLEAVGMLPNAAKTTSAAMAGETPKEWADAKKKYPADPVFPDGKPLSIRVKELQDEEGMTFQDAQDVALAELPPETIKDFAAGGTIPKPEMEAALDYDSIPDLKKGTKLNLSNTGPKGNLRNIKAMQPAKLKALIEHPDVDPDLRDRARKQLAAKGYNVPGTGGAAVPKKPVAAKVAPDAPVGTGMAPTYPEEKIKVPGSAGPGSYSEPTMVPGDGIKLNGWFSSKPENSEMLFPDIAQGEPTTVKRIVELDKLEYEDFLTNMTADRPWVTQNNDIAASGESFAVIGPEGNAFLIDPQGYDYPRYVAPLNDEMTQVIRDNAGAAAFAKGGGTTDELADQMFEQVLGSMPDSQGPGSGPSKLRSSYDFALGQAKKLNDGEQYSLGAGSTFRLQRDGDSYKVVKGTDLDAALDPSSGKPMVYDTPEEAAAFAVAAEEMKDSFSPESPKPKKPAKSAPLGDDAKKIAAAWEKYNAKLEAFKAIPESDKKERARVAAQVRAAKYRIKKAGGDPDNPAQYGPKSKKAAPKTPGPSGKAFKASTKKTDYGDGVATYGEFGSSTKEGAKALVDELNALVAENPDGVTDKDVLDVLNFVDGEHPDAGITDTVVREEVLDAFEKKKLLKQEILDQWAAETAASQAKLKKRNEEMAARQKLVDDYFSAKEVVPHNGKDFAMFSAKDNREARKAIDQATEKGTKPLTIEEYRKLLGFLDENFDGGGDTAVRDEVFDYLVDMGLLQKSVVEEIALDPQKVLSQWGRGAKVTPAKRKQLEKRMKDARSKLAKTGYFN